MRLLLRLFKPFLYIIAFCLILKAIRATASFFKQAKDEAEREREEEEAERKRIERRKKAFKKAKPFFRDDISPSAFKSIVQDAASHYKRLEQFFVDGHKVYGSVSAQSGITTWSFVISFDRFGHLSSEYRIETENYDSAIPDSIANRISTKIKEWPSSKDAGNDSAKQALKQSKGQNSFRPSYCPHCGKKIPSETYSYCPFCGGSLPPIS